jgi:hypothetical protein
MLYFRILLNNNLVMPKAGKQDATAYGFQIHPSGRRREERNGRGARSVVMRKRERRREMGHLMKLCTAGRARALSAAPISRRRCARFLMRNTRQANNNDHSLVPFDDVRSGQIWHQL